MFRKSKDPPVGVEPGAEPPAPPADAQLPAIARTGDRPSSRASEIRDSITDYVNGVGAVPWQNRMANVDNEVE